MDTRPVAPIFTPIRDQTLRAQVKFEIRRRIISGDIEAGVTYRISDFVNQLGVSATPMREAILDLANDGLIEMLPNRGFRVPLLTDADLDQLFYLRILIEGSSVANAVQVINDKAVEALRSFAAQTREAARREDLYAFIEWDSRFHLGLLEPLANRRLLDIVSRLRDESGLYRQSFVSGTGLLDVAADEHEAILHAIEQRDGPFAGELMRRHLQHTHEIYKQRRRLTGK